MSARILLVTGSRALANPHDEMRCSSLLAMFAKMFRPTVVVAGDADGPDSWAINWAISNEIDTRIYSLDAHVRTAAGAVVRRWYEGEPPQPMRDWPLIRNERMVRDVARQARQGATVEVLALEAAWSATKGTAHTVSQALTRGLAVTQVLITRARIQEGAK